MGQQESKTVTRSGVYQQELIKEDKGSDTAKRIRKQLQQGKVKPEQPNFPIQQYQPPTQIQAPPSPPPPQPQTIYQQQPPPQQIIVQQQPRRNIEIKSPQEMIRQEHQRRPSSNKNRPPDGKPPKPKSAKVMIAQVPTNKAQIQHQNIVRLSKEPFSNCLKTEKGFLQNCQMSLAQLIQSRYNTKMYFPQQNVITLLQSIIYALAALEAKQIYHHDVFPTTIFFQNGVFKLSNPILTPLSSYSLTLQRKRFSYLSPELIIYLRQQIQDIKQDLLYRSDVFAFGLIMLEFCSLKPSSECYDQENYDIIDAVIKRRLAQIKQIYNPLISEAIQRLLEYQVQQRMSAFEFSKHLNQHVHQHQLELANAKKSQLTIQGELQSTRSAPIASNNLPQNKTSQPPLIVSQHQVFQQPPSAVPPYSQQIISEKPTRAPLSPSQTLVQHHFPPPQPNIQPPSQQTHIQSQGNSLLHNNQSYPLSPLENQVESTFSPSQAIPSYPYIQSPISPIPPETYVQQIQRNYQPYPTAYDKQLQQPKSYLPSHEHTNNPYSAGYQNKFSTFTSNSQYSPDTYNLPRSTSNGMMKTLGQLQYNIPSYKDTFMKPEKDSLRQIGGGYKQYKNTYKQTTTQIYNNDPYKDREWNETKTELNSKYIYGNTFSDFASPVSPRNEEQSLEQRVRRILQKSKQIK